MRSRGELAALIVMAFLRAVVALGRRAKACNASATCGAAPATPRAMARPFFVTPPLDRAAMIHSALSRSTTPMGGVPQIVKSRTVTTR